MVELLEPAPGQQILELAAGPGDTGFLALPALEPGGELITTDVAPEMVEAASRGAVELGLDNVRFAVEDAAALTLADDSVDGVLCRFGLMLVPEMDRAVREIARVVRPRGRAVIAVWASSRLNPWLTATGRAALELGFAEPPDPSAPGPFRLADEDELRSVILEGSLEILDVEDVPVTWTAASLDEWWEASRDCSRNLTVLLEQLSGADAGALRQRAEEFLLEFQAPDGSLAVPGLARVVVATPV